ncbi:hypothetical protein F2Q69_00008872 [Brassica cretica]|uniref:Uncharacterized protein n=1 Tax=Brassica cretica TaxID=69181 RepID=A0A8S9P2C1_BRACR|nr:hypothetical protein F2Q69_00008872 [Brassica cretica]
MSDSIPVKINCFHSGVFKNDEDGKLNYVDGFMDQFEVNGDAVYEEFLKIIVLKVSVGRMWYKLPYEDISENELLENGEKNKKRMASNGRYYGELDVFIEKPETSVVIVDGVVVDSETEHEAIDDAELQNDEVDGNELDAELQDDEVDGDDEAEESEDEYQESKWRGLYMDGLGAVNGPRFWKLSGADRIEAPPYKRPPGRAKGKARIKGVRESPKKNHTKVDRKGSVLVRKRRRLNMEQQSHEQAIEDGSSTAPPATQP